MGNIVTFGEIMLRLASPGYERFGQGNILNALFGGGEANVAVSLSNYGLQTIFVTRLPDNPLADACVRELRSFGVGTSYILRGGKRIGIYFLETGAVNRPSKVVYDRAYSAFSEIETGMINWDSVFQDAIWFHWSGITPGISQGAADVCAEAISVAKKKGIYVSTDLNYRKNLWKYGKTPLEVMPELVKGCDLILGNEEDAGMVLDIHPKHVDITTGKLDIGAYLSVSKQIMEQFPNCKKVVTTLRGSINANHNTWTGILYDGQKMYTAPLYDITHIVDRVGGGDSFMGGLIYGLLHYKKDVQSALNFAVSASALKHTISGDYNRVTVEEVENLMSGDASGRISR